MFEQWCEPGHGAPTHLHAVEEILRVFEGQADVWIGAARATLTAGQLVTVPAGRKHGFTNTGTTTLRIQSTLAAPVFEAAYDDARETPRRWCRMHVARLEPPLLRSLCELRRFESAEARSA